MPTLTLLGLGPGDPNLLTRAAWDFLAQVVLLYTPTPTHPALAHLPAEHIQPLPPNDPQASSIILKNQLALGKDVACALADTPFNHPLTLALADETLQIIPGVSSLDVLIAKNQSSFARLEAIVMRLIGPGGCPWDQQQTHQSLRSGLLEETYEVLEALDTNDLPGLAEELGDLLLQVLFHSELARRAGTFDLGDVLAQISTKLINRHPHVFGEFKVNDPSEVLQNWQQIKNQELAAKGRQRASVLDGIPPGLPALATAQKIVGKAARLNCDWATCNEAWAKLHEELAEFLEAFQIAEREATLEHQAHLSAEYGDLLFALAHLGSWLNLDAESSLRSTIAKYQRRFNFLEQSVQKRGLDLATLSRVEKECLWAEAKQIKG